MEIKENSDSSFVKIESDKNNFKEEDSIRLNSIRDENLIECNPHNYQSYFQKVQIVGEYKFIDDHNKIFQKNLDKKNSYKNLDSKIIEENLIIPQKNIDQSNKSFIANDNNKEIEKLNDIDDEKRDNSNILNNNIVKDVREKEENDIKNEGLDEFNKEGKINRNEVKEIEEKEKIPVEKNNNEKKHNTTCCYIL